MKKCMICGKAIKNHNSYCKECLTRTKRDKGLDTFINRLAIKCPTLEYICGYTNSDGKATIRCKICGDIFVRNVARIRGNKKITCIRCKDNKRLKQKETQELLKKQKTYIENKIQEEQKELQSILDRIVKNTIYIKKCKYCGKEITTPYKHKTNCDECNARRDKHSRKSIQKLYKRDKGICYICGGKCDFEDYIVSNNTIICGNYYPSIDHVIPLSKGGTDDWSNLKLAHRICNTIKGNKIVF